MKKIIRKVFFIFKFSFKNIGAHPLRSFLLALGFIGVSLTLFLAISMHSVMFSFYYAKVEDVYQDTDMILEVSNQSDSRFFSISHFTDQEISQMIDDYDAFFEFDVLITHNQDKNYVHVFASDIASLKNISGANQIDIESLNSNEVIITKSYAQNNNLSISDTISIQASDTSKTFIIVDIIEDAHQFTGQSIFIDKNTSLSFFLESLSPLLASFPQTLLNRLYNRVYINLNSEYTYDAAADVFKTVDAYKALSYVETYNMAEINTNVDQATALFDVVIIFVFMAIVLVLETTLIVYFNDKKKMSGIIQILGGKKTFSLSVMLIELFIFELMALIFGKIFTNLIIKKGLTFLGSSRIYQLSQTQIIESCAMSIFVFVIFILIHFIKFKQDGDIKQLQDKGQEKNMHIVKQFIMVICAIVLYFVFKLTFVYSLIGKYCSIFQIVIALFVLYELSYLIINLLSLIKFKHKQFKIHQLLFNKMIHKKQFYHYISMVLTVFIMITLLLFTIDHMQNRIDRLTNEYQFDLVITRIMNNEDDVLQSVVQMEDVDDAVLVGYYQNLSTAFENKALEQVISINENEIDNFFNFDIDLETRERFSSNTLQIILPIQYHEIYQFEIGNDFYLDLSPIYQNVPFKIAGFYQKDIDELAFINLYQDSTYQDINNNAILITSNNKEVLKEELIDRYGQQMMVIYDYRAEVMLPIENQLLKVKTYITFVIEMMILSFVISLINHTTMLHISKSSDDAKIYTLGLSKNKIIYYQILNQMIIFLVTIGVSLISFIMIYKALSEFISIFGTYEYLELFIPSIYKTFGINLCIWILIISYQIVLIKKTNYIALIRTY